MTHLTPERWRRLVEKDLGRIPDIVWDHINEEDHVNTANSDSFDEDGERLEYLIEVTEKALDYFHRIRSTGPRLPQDAQKKPPKELLPQKEKPPDTQTAALTRVIVALLDKEEPIRKFRSDVLAGKLLTSREALPWLKSLAEKEGCDQKISITFSASMDIKPAPGSFLTAAEECLLAAKQDRVPRGVKYDHFTLSCLTPGGSTKEIVPISTQGILAWLKSLAEKYEAFWPEAAAVHFILTGQSYPVRRAKVVYGDSGNIPYVSLRVHPSLSGDEVRGLYLAARNCLEGCPGNTSAKGLTEKHLALAVHAVEHVGSWNMRLRKWNKTCPAEWVYPASARATFARDCRAAYERLTGWKWQEETKK